MKKKFYKKKFNKKSKNLTGKNRTKNIKKTETLEQQKKLKKE